MAVWKLVSKADENRAPITKQYVDEFLDAVGIIIDAMHTTSGRRGFNNEVIHRNKIDMDIQQATDKLSLLVQKLNVSNQLRLEGVDGCLPTGNSFSRSS